MTSSLETSSSQLTIFLILGGVCAVIVAMVGALYIKRTLYVGMKLKDKTHTRTN
jgi:hypothetical protein